MDVKKNVERIDFLDATTEATYKCGQCGNMFEVALENCDVCGFHCSEDACQIIQTSNEGY